jgi:hypothetical protein
MKVAFLTPIGPSHEHRMPWVTESCETAFRVNRGPFTEMKNFFLDDSQGYWGRAAARNVMLGMAHGWGADWIIFIDATDVLHPRALMRVGEVLEKNPDVQTIMGALSLWWKPADAIRHEVGEPGKTQHLYRAEADICPLSWDDLIEGSNMGTVGTHSAVRMGLAWKLGFRPDLPAAEYFEWTHVLFACAPFEKIPHPIVVIDRSTNHAFKADDPNVNHGPMLNESIAAITHAWGERGRVPLTYEELEERWSLRDYRTEDLVREMHMTDIAMDPHAHQREF